MAFHSADTVPEVGNPDTEIELTSRLLETGVGGDADIVARSQSRQSQKPWRPRALRKRFMIPLIIILSILAGLLQFLRWYVNVHLGGIGSISDSTYVHFAWTIPPVALATAITLLLGSVVFKVERLMPWFAMACSAEPAKSSIGLDYLDSPAPLIPWRAWKYRHWMVLTCSLISLLAMGLSSSLAPLMYLKSVVVDQSQTVLTSSDPGMVHWFNDLEAFYSAMADMTYAIKNGDNGRPAPLPWISSDGWAVPRFTIDEAVVQAAKIAVQNQHLSATNMSAQVSAIYHDAGCESTTLKITTDGLLNFSTIATGVKTGCTYSRIIPLSTVCCNQDGTGCCDNWDGDLTPCGRTQPDGLPLDPSQQSFVFWTARTVSFDPFHLPNVSVTICTPSYQLRQKVNALIDVTSTVVLDANPMSKKTFQIDPIFNGSAFNGFGLDYFNSAADGIEGYRKDAIRTGLLSAIVFKGETWPYSPYLNDSYTFITQNVYLTYLSLVARDVYFTVEGPIFNITSNSGNVVLHSPEVRLFVNTLSAHFGSGILGTIALGLSITAILLFRIQDRPIPVNEGQIVTSAIATKDLNKDKLLTLDSKDRYYTEEVDDGIIVIRYK